MADNNDEKRLEFIYEEIKGRLAVQTDNMRALDTIAGAIGGVTLVLAGLIFSGEFVGRVHVAFGIVLIPVLAASLIMTLLVYLTRELWTVPKPRRLYERYIGRDYQEILLALILAAVEAFERNETPMRRKRNSLARAGALLIAAFVAFGVTVVLYWGNP